MRCKAVISVPVLRRIIFCGTAVLKKEVSKGRPVIVLIRTWKNQNWLHFVPVVGYDEDYIFVAESLKELVDCNERYYNRKIAVNEFRKLWNTSMWKMPCYRNTYIIMND